MKRGILTATALTLCLVALSGCWLLPITIDDSADGTIQVVSVGDTVIVRLSGNASSGYQWIRSEPASFDDTALDVIEEGEYEDDDEGVCGGPGTFRFTYEAVKAGLITLTFEYRRPWEDEIIDTFSVVVWVK